VTSSWFLIPQRTLVFMLRARYFCPILTSLDILNGCSVKIPNIKFYVYRFRRSHVDTRGQKDEPKDTDGRTDGNEEGHRCFSRFCEHAWEGTTN